MLTPTTDTTDVAQENVRSCLHSVYNLPDSRVDFDSQVHVHGSQNALEYQVAKLRFESSAVLAVTRVRRSRVGIDVPVESGLLHFCLSGQPFTLGVGASQVITVAATALNGFTGTINVSLSGLAMGVSANPAAFTLQPATQQQVTLTAATSASPGTATLTFQATSGNLSHTARASIALVAPVTTAHPPIRLVICAPILFTTQTLWDTTRPTSPLMTLCTSSFLSATRSERD